MFEEEKQEVFRPPPEPIPAAMSEEGGNENGADFSFQRPKKQKKVCIVEEDIKMTKDEIEIYNEMKQEAELERAEAAQLFQEQQMQEPDLEPAQMTQESPVPKSAQRGRKGKR